MPISLTELNNLQAELTVEIFPGGDVSLVYKLDGFTDEVNGMIDQALAGGMHIKAGCYRKILERLLVSWDIEQSKGKPLPITPEGLAKLKLPVLDKLMAGILGDRDPNLIRTGSQPHLQAVT
jgi:hypothetical protein